MKTLALRNSLLAGAIGVVLGAASMQVANQVLDASASHSRPSTRGIIERGIENQNERTGTRPDVVVPKKAI